MSDPSTMPTEPGDLTGARPAAPTSVLTSLRDRKKAVVDSLHLDLPVPRMEPAVLVRFKPVSDARVQAINKQFEKSKDPDRVVRLNATVLANCVVGVFQLDGDDEVSIDVEDLHGELPKFDERLGALLGMDVDFAKNPVNVIRELYATDGDVIATAAKVADWSGYSLDVEEREGN